MALPPGSVTPTREIQHHSGHLRPGRSLAIGVYGGIAILSLAFSFRVTDGECTGWCNRIRDLDVPGEMVALLTSYYYGTSFLP